MQRVTQGRTLAHGLCSSWYADQAQGFDRASDHFEGILTAFDLPGFETLPISISVSK
jgi:hypothetical protein